MKRWTFFCAVLVLLQIGLTVWTHFDRRTEGSEASKGPLFTMAAVEIDELLLADGDGRTLAFKKEQGRWVLPESGGFPADTARIQGLIERLTGMQRGWPEATTAEAATRFKVAPDRFERKLQLRGGGRDLGVVYLGASPGLRKMYLRVDGDSEIQAMAVAQHELEVKVDNWIDAAVLHLKPEQIASIALPGLRLERGADGLQPADLTAAEELIKDRRDALVKHLSGLSISAILGKEPKPEHGLDRPALLYTVELEGGGRIDYVFGQPPQAEKIEGKESPLPAIEQNYVLKVSSQEQLLRVDGWQVEEIRKATRASLVRAKAGQSAESAETPPAASAQPGSQGK